MSVSNMMSNDDMQCLFELLQTFEQIEGHSGSVCGRKMDVAVSKSMRSALIAYGLTWTPEFTCYDGTKVKGHPHYDREQVVTSAERVINDAEYAQDYMHFNSHPVSYTLI